MGFQSMHIFVMIVTGTYILLDNR